MSLKGILGGIDVDVIREQYSTDQNPPGLLGTYKRLDGIKGCEYRTSSWHSGLSEGKLYATHLKEWRRPLSKGFIEPLFTPYRAQPRSTRFVVANPQPALG